MVGIGDSWIEKSELLVGVIECLVEGGVLRSDGISAGSAQNDCCCIGEVGMITLDDNDVVSRSDIGSAGAAQSDFCGV